jgi:hypothetical protein
LLEAAGFTVIEPGIAEERRPRKCKKCCHQEGERQGAEERGAEAESAAMTARPNEAAKAKRDSFFGIVLIYCL